MTQIRLGGAANTGLCRTTSAQGVLGPGDADAIEGADNARGAPEDENV